MNKLQNWLLALILLIVSPLVAIGQSGIIKTDRTNIGTISFSENSSISNIGDSRHVDGYVKKYGNGVFLFPVGHHGAYRPFAAEASGTLGAYFKENPASTTLPAGAPFSTNSKDPSISQISSQEYWDIDGTNPTKITLTWNAGSSIGTLTANSLSALTIVGWNAGSSRWERITSTFDEISVFATASSLQSGSISTKLPIVPDQYKILTLAASATPTLPPKL